MIRAGGIALVLVAVRLAWADHGVGLSGGPMNPWLSALLWGGLGLAVAMIVAIIVMVFTRDPTEKRPDEHLRQ